MRDAIDPAVGSAVVLLVVALLMLLLPPPTLLKLVCYARNELVLGYWLRCRISCH